MIRYQLNTHLQTQDIIRVFNASGITRPTHDAARIASMFTQANLIVSAWHDNLLVGVALAV
jgi:hypothetical protein